MNHSLVAADRVTHIKIIVVALITSIAVILAAVYTRLVEPASRFDRIRADASVLKPVQSKIAVHNVSQPRSPI
jgi:hypothetical protein